MGSRPASARVLGNHGSRLRVPHGAFAKTGLQFAERHRILEARRDEALQAVEAALQLLHRSRVGDANVVVGAERFAGNHRDEFFRQQLLGELQRVRDAVVVTRR